MHEKSLGSFTLSAQTCLQRALSVTINYISEMFQAYNDKMLHVNIVRLWDLISNVLYKLTVDIASVLLFVIYRYY